MKLGLGALLLTFLFAASGDQDREAAAAVRAAESLIADMGARRSQLVLPLGSEHREQWAYVPGTRQGVNWKEMSASQQRRARSLLAAALSDWGISRMTHIREVLEPELRRLEGNPGRDEGLYWFVIFGDPSNTEPWSWRYEGHHLSVTFTYAKGKIVSSTPLFLGANPAKHSKGQTLREEEELGRALIKSLTAAQQAVVIASPAAPADIVTSNDRVAVLKERKGIRLGDLTGPQQALLRELVQLYAKVLKPEAMAQRLERVERGGWNEVRFAWMGGLEPGEGHYYCISGPKFAIEYDNTQNGANHIHTVWRDFEGDFGRDALADHYRSNRH
jgi:hypothetical protein